MKNNNIPTIKLRIQYELAYEIIHYSLIFIAFGLAYIFASNLLSFNWFTVLFIILATLLIYFKKENYILIKNNMLQIIYWKFLTSKEIQMKDIKEFTFYEKSRLVEIELSNNEVLTCYLKKKQREKLLNYLILYFPRIPCILIN